METVIFFIVYGLIGTIIGRILFRHRLGHSSRYMVDWERNEYGEKLRKTLADTRDGLSAKTYGLWSIPFWPLALAIYLVQAPTPQEKQAKKDEQLAELVEKAGLTLTELRH